MLVDVKETHVPSLEEVAQVLQSGLSKTFKEVTVNVVDCPNLTSAPFHLAAPGLGGSPRLADVGGVPYLMPEAQKDRWYDLKDVPSLCGMDSAFIVGAGAGPWKDLGVNAELMANLKVKGNQVDNQSRVALVNSAGCCDLQTLNNNQTGNGLLSNLFISEGKPGKVLEIKASRRYGDDNFITCMRKTLKDHYEEKPVALGGCFLLENGEAKIHVMPDFSDKPLSTDEDLEKWLKFYTMRAPMIFLSIFVSHDPDLDLRVEHSHGFSLHGEGGHYHYDTTPDTVSYRGYFNIAESIFRIDRPSVTHRIGRD